MNNVIQTIVRVIGWDKDFEPADYEFAEKNFNDNLEYILSHESEKNIDYIKNFIDIIAKVGTCDANDPGLYCLKKTDNIICLFAGRDVLIERNMLMDKYKIENTNYRNKLKELIIKNQIIDTQDVSENCINEFSLAELNLTPKQYIYLNKLGINTLTDLYNYDFTDEIKNHKIYKDEVWLIRNKLKKFFLTHED